MSRMRPMNRMRRNRALLAILAGLIAWAGAEPAGANSTSFATAGTGTFAPSIAWLDFTGYSDAAAAAGGQAFSFTLPNGAGTLTTTVTRTGNGTMVVSAEPAWSGGGAFGHGAYNGISGNPIFYWLSQPGTGTIALGGLTVKDPAGNARSFTLTAADGENTNSPESIAFAGSAAWQLLQTDSNYADFNGGAPSLSGLGSTSVLESPPASSDNNYNATVLLYTHTPSQVSAAFSGNEAALFGVSLASVTFNISIGSRIVAADESGGHAEDRQHQQHRRRGRHRGDHRHRHERRQPRGCHGVRQSFRARLLRRQHGLQQQRTGRRHLRRHQHRAARRQRHEFHGDAASRRCHHLYADVVGGRRNRGGQCLRRCQRE
jgi:hypothetical protein